MQSDAKVMPSCHCLIPVWQSVKKQFDATVLACSLFFIASCELLLLNSASRLVSLKLMGATTPHPSDVATGDNIYATLQLF